MGATVFAAANGTEIKLKVKNKKEAVLFRTKTVAEVRYFDSYIFIKVFYRLMYL